MINVAVYASHLLSGPSFYMLVEAVPRPGDRIVITGEISAEVDHVIYRQCNGPLAGTNGILYMPGIEVWCKDAKILKDDNETLRT